MTWDYKLDNHDLEATPQFEICNDCGCAIDDEPNDPSEFGLVVCECGEGENE